jgi:hypothetical protein
MRIEGMELPSPHDIALANFEDVMKNGSFRQKEALCMVLSHMARLNVGPRCAPMAKGIADYWLAVQSGDIK